MPIARKWAQRSWATYFFALIAASTSRLGATQYDMVSDFNLSPYVTGGYGFGVYHGQAVGLSPLTITTAGAVLWSSPSQRITLNPGPGVSSNYPLGYQTSTAYAIHGNQQVGFGVAQDHNQHALLWTGSAASVVDLSLGPAGIGYATATDGDQQVGVVSGGIGGDAALWSGTAASFVNLNPSGYDQSYAQGVFGDIQVGYGTQHGGGTNALLWHGTASSFTVLAVGAEAMGISRGQVVGLTGNSRPGSLRDAAIWNLANPSTLIDVAPANTTASELFATNGTQQVGDYSTQAGVGTELPVDHHAAVWTGTTATFQPLPVPTGDNWSKAYSIDGDGNILGVAGIGSNGDASGVIPVMWVPHRLSGDANFDGIVNFSDLLILVQHYGQPGEWVDGEFSGGGTVNFADLLTLAQHYGMSQTVNQFTVQVADQQGSGQVPEPSLSVLVLLAIGTACRCRKLQ